MTIYDPLVNFENRAHAGSQIPTHYSYSAISSPD